MLLLNLLGGRLPMGYRMAGTSAGAVQRRVQDRLDRVLRRMVRVAGLLDEALGSVPSFARPIVDGAINSCGIPTTKNGRCYALG